MAGGKGKPPASRELQGFAEELRTESRAPRRELFSQLFEALQTGGIGAQIPIVQRAVESSSLASSNALRQVEANLVRAGLDRTPHGQNVLAQTLLQGELTKSRVPTEVIQQFLQMAPGLVTGTGQTVVAGLGSAAGAQATVQAAQIAAMAQMVSAAMEAVSGAIPKK